MGSRCAWARRSPERASGPLSPDFPVRPDGAVYQWRKVPPSELSVALVADERFGGATYRAEAS
jgi:hypothetical protein